MKAKSDIKQQVLLFFHSLTWKLLCVTVCLFFLFAGIVTRVWTQRMTSQASETASRDLYSIMQVSNNNFGTALKDINSITALISSNMGFGLNSRIFNYLMNENEDDQLLLQYRRDAEDYIFSLCNFKSYLNGLAVSDLSGNTLSYGIFMNGRDLTAQPWFQELVQSDQDLLFVPPHYYDPAGGYPGDLVFSIARKIRHQGQVIGVVVADIKCSLLEDMFHVQNVNGYSMLILDPDTESVIFPQEEEQRILTDQELKLLTASPHREDGYFTTELGGRDCLVIEQNASITDWTVIGFVPYENILEDFMTTRAVVFRIALVCAVIFILTVTLFISIITRKLTRLSTAVSKIDSGQLELNISIQTKDEVGRLYRQITYMIRRIRELIEDIRTRENEKRNLEIKALQAQINPHFLYNTLNTIKFLAAVQGAQNIQSVTQALSDMLHVNLSPQKYVTVAEETDYLKHYLEIQEYRFNGKFTSYFSVDTALNSYLIPKLLLQPLVENALLHGIAPVTRPGYLQIRIFQDKDQLYIRIKDNGKGMTQEELNTLSHAVDSDASHIGIANIRSRLELMFGSRQSFTIISKPDLYTMAELSFPLFTAESAGDFR